MHLRHTAPRHATMLLLAWCLGLSATAAAASFNCGKARTVVEKAVCANPGLSARDERLAALYQRHLAGGAAVQMKAGQRAWLEYLPASCAGKDGVTACLLEAYDKRIALLAGLLALQDRPTPSAADGEGYRHTFKTISEKYDFALQLLQQCAAQTDDTSGSCEAPGVISVFEKGGRVPLQAIPMENIVVSFSQSAVPLSNSSRLYDYQGVINVGDFNFDGKQDFAIQNGNSGSYGGPSYDVYLAAPAGQSFVFSPDLTELIASTLGFFQVDARSKRLKTLAKGGCCHHEATTYQVVRDMPVPVARSVDEITLDGGVVREERLEGGKWKLVSTRHYRPEGYCEEFLESLASEHLSYGKHTDYNDTKACDLVPGQKGVGIFASYYPRRDVAGDLYTDDQYKGLDVLVGDMNQPGAVATYREPAQFLRGKATGLVIDTAPYPLHPGQRVLGVRNAFAYVGQEGSFERLNLFEQSGNALQNVLRNLVTRADTTNLSLLRVVSVDKAFHGERHDILIQETRTVKVAGKPQTPQRKDYRLQFDGHAYAMPEGLTLLP